MDASVSLAALQAAPDATLIVDPAGTIEFASDRVLATLGFTPAELIGRSVDSLLPETLRAGHAVRRAAFGVTPGARSMGSGLQLTALHASGAAIPVEICLAPIAVPGGSRVICSIRSVVERRAVERELRDATESAETRTRESEAEARQHRELLRLVMAHMPGAAAMVDREMRYVAVTPAWLSDFGIALHDVIGESHYDVFPEIPERWRALHRRALAGETLGARDDFFVRRDGRTEWLDWEMRPWPDVRGEIGGILLFSAVTTARHEAAAALRLSEERFRGAFSKAAIGMAFAALDGSWLDVNDTLCEMLGYSRDEMLATTIPAITHPDDIELDRRLARELLEGTRSGYRIGKRYFNKRGHVVHTLMSATLLRDSAGTPVHFVGQMQDITEQRLAEARVRESEQRLRTIADVVPVAIALFDHDDIVRFSNREFDRIAGRRAEGLRAEQALPPTLHAASHPHRRRALAGESSDLTSQVRVGDATEHREISYRPLLDEFGAIVGVCGVGYDVTDRVERYAAIRQHEAQLSAIFASMSEGLVVQDAAGQIVEANQAAEALLGMSREQLLGRTSLDPEWRAIREDGSHFDGSDHPSMVVLRTGHPVRNQIMGVQVGSLAVRWISINAHPLSRTTTDGGAVITTFIDVTAQRLAFERIRALAQRLESVRDDERQAVARQLHEGIAQDLYAMRLTLTQLAAESLGRTGVQRACEDLERLVRKSMDDARQMANDLHPAALVHLRVAVALEHHARFFGPLSGLEIVVAEAPRFPTLSEAARLLLFRAVQEALTNVAKHAQARRVDVTLAASASEITVRVTDDGVGISPDALSRPRSLGLLGMRERAEAHGGWLRVERNPGAPGTTMTMALPRGRFEAS